VTRRRVVLSDPDASPPVYPWGSAPDRLATRAQLKKLGLRPGRQGVQALVMWYGRGGRPTIDGCRYAEMYDVTIARPRIAVSARRARSLQNALAARMTCPRCGVNRGYVPSRRLGVCNVCADLLGLAA
jgi:hypothetical protein